VINLYNAIKVEHFWVKRRNTDGTSIFKIESDSQVIVRATISTRSFIVCDLHERPLSN